MSLKRDGRTLIGREALVQLSASQVVTVTLSRACANIRCPDADPLATECFNGSCVRPECTPETPEACTAEQCASIDDCTPIDEPCGSVLCTRGACLFSPTTGFCAAGEVCIPERGCVEELRSDAGSDAGDAGTDASDSGAGCTPGVSCNTGRDCELGIVDCSTGEPICAAEGPMSAGTLCRGSENAYDSEEQCDGVSPVCPDDASAPAGTPCDTGFCNGFVCGRCEPGPACEPAQSCATGTIVCDGDRARCEPMGFRPSSYACRSSVDTCDIAERCTGTSAECPRDRFQPPSQECRASAGECDRRETCTGTNAFCPSDTFLPASNNCRGRRGSCDVIERCTGFGALCPADEFRVAGLECRAATTLCDLAEVCTGVSPSCPSDAVRAAGSECRPENGDCDVAETCDGINPTCPADAFQGPEGFAGLCRWHIPDEACDPLELCDGTGPDCPRDVFLPNGTICHECGLGGCDGTCQTGRCTN